MHRHGFPEETFWFYSFAPVRGEGGDVLGVFVNAMDITGQVVGEQALHESEEALRDLNATLSTQVEARTEERDRIWNVSQDLLGVADSNGVWLSVNPAFQRITGWKRSQLIGQTSGWLEHPDDREKTRAEIQTLAAGQTTLNFQNRWRRQDGTYCHLSWTAVPLDGLNYCVARDITEEDERKATLLRTEEALRQSLKMEAVGQLTGGLAHDFNNLLTAITGTLELIDLRLSQGRAAEVTRHLTVARSSTDRAAALTHRLLAFSRRQTLDPKPVLLNRLISGVEDMIRRTIGPSIKLEVVGAGGLWIARCDPNQLENALLNLCINARDAMPDGGRLTIETANASLDSYAARTRGVPRGQFVIISVTDTGVGMSSDVLDHVFEPFFTTKPTGEGTGLGLSMVYGFVRQSGGEARIYSEAGQGTTVKLYLPRHYGEEEDTVDEFSAHEATEDSTGQTVLFVDDEPAIREIAGEVLHDIGCAHLEASDGASAMRLLQSGAKIDLLITDVGLPGGINGRQLADAACELIPALKVLFATGFAENAVLGNGILGPRMQVMTKPFSLQTFALRVRELLNSS